ncbi:MAG: bis(5'-nucleosyl)-tetraphosphatase (symmetrical) YqeK [Oscillospiraceae bacterium]|nr:bis(5'-nucleosyl)-tetraphosphatase (symmetrical) YqeK [Oscillospiraceae bacterium]
MTCEEVKEILKIRLSKKRYTHSLNVANEAVKLAKAYGGDEDKAYLAGLTHDICKEIPQEEQLMMAKSCGMDFTETESLIPPLYHSAAGAYYLKKVLHIDDTDILAAVRYHTAGRAGMSLLEKIIYIADLISADRTYKDVSRMRKLAYEDLDKAMFEALRFSISDTLNKSSFIPESTWAAYNFFAKMMKG